jgi:acyl dehydratase
MATFSSVEELKAAVGTHIGTGDWLAIDQKRIDTFADATGDHQWIHVDPERAKEGPFGKPIAHGFLTLSLNPLLCKSAYEVTGVKMGVNYGLNKVRFTNPVPVDSRIRGSYELVSAEDVKGGGVQLTVKATIELEGSERPAAVAETVVRYFF